jgi:hypothetical protein
MLRFIASEANVELNAANPSLSVCARRLVDGVARQQRDGRRRGALREPRVMLIGSSAVRGAGVMGLTAAPCVTAPPEGCVVNRSARGIRRRG